MYSLRYKGKKLQLIHKLGTDCEWVAATFECPVLAIKACAHLNAIKA